MNRKTGSIAASILVLSLGAAEAEGDWDAYVPRTLRSVIDANKSEVLPESVTLYTASNFPTRATVVYQGNVQSIPGSRLEFLKEYFEKVRQRPEWVGMYSEEVLCREGEVDYWLPIQSSVLTYFKDEVAAGASVELFVTWIGARRTGEQVEWIFTINEFEAVTP